MRRRTTPREPIIEAVPPEPERFYRQGPFILALSVAALLAATLALGSLAEGGDDQTSDASDPKDAADRARQHDTFLDLMAQQPGVQGRVAASTAETGRRVQVTIGDPEHPGNLLTYACWGPGTLTIDVRPALESRPGHAAQRCDGSVVRVHTSTPTRVTLTPTTTTTSISYALSATKTGVEADARSSG
ncbi:hypothetical protein DY218_24075 [Streptomyces triticagri]|uniref:Uncharacterized protein n=1 Tax=Streptomyces triticagri TaxID=2293568 RepID=A0A372M1G4_9ACTN|nr:hypothetical protein [Streptomyces triticagri]RFU84127.1 hypothetical protein DY218_24075 [Streptomyces triticagri]